MISLPNKLRFPFRNNHGYSIALCQHFLPSVTWLLNEFEQMSRENLRALGKEYSSFLDPGFKAPLAGQAFDLAVDEGDVLTRLGVTAKASVEQTTGGIRADYQQPCVWVARSAAKLQLESQVIADGILAKLLSLFPNERKFGVIGGGALGSALAARLLAQNALVGTHDRRQLAAQSSMPLRELIAKSNVLLGCVGRSLVNIADLENLIGKKVFVSCSSARREFADLIMSAHAASEYDSFTWSFGNLEFAVLNGGYPINFDRQREWEDPNGIWLTRRLVLSGAEQALGLIGKTPGGYMLDPQAQLRDIGLWIDQLPDPSRYQIPEFNLSQLIQYSEGIYQMTAAPYDVHETTPNAIANMRRHTEPYEVEVRGIDIVVLPGVWSPAYDWSSDFNVEFLPPVEGLDFLEVGPGTGVISTHAGLRGARSILAADVNPQAVENTRANFSKHKITQGSAIVSEGFDDISGSFDVIIFNAPYHGNKPNDLLERGASDEDYRSIKAFFRDVAAHLKPGGTLQFGASESGDLVVLRALFQDAGFRIRRELSDWRQGYNCMLFDLEINELKTEK
jgi:release factor glutamine methyltransferase